MADLVIGEDPINLDELAEMIENSPYYPQLLKDWEFFLEYLEVPHNNNLVLKEGGGGKGLLHEVLSIWRAEKGRGARLSLLYDAFINCMAIDITALLEEKYWLVAVKSLKIRFPGGEEVSLEQVTESTSEWHYERICKEVRFHNILWGQCIELPRIEAKSDDLYIPRKLSRTTEVDAKIFAEASYSTPDVFIVKGIGTEQLEKISACQPVDVTGNQLHDVRVRIMALECDEHFHRICENIKYPVHLFEHKKGSFFWIKSRGNISTIQRFIQGSKNYFSENELISHIPHRTTIISDSAGMGKSSFLFNLAQKPSATNRSIVMFIPLRELSFEVKGFFGSEREAFLYIFESICANIATVFVLLEMLKNSSYHFDFFFDGYDDLSSDKLKWVDLFLSQLKDFKNVRIYMATRPHLRFRLENVLSEISYEILPFEKSDQVQFLTSYWLNEFGVTKYKEKLRSYAQKCLEMLREHTTESEQEIFGFPLHCLEIAKAFQKDVHKGLILSLEAADVIDIATMFSTCKSLVDLKFGNIFSSMYWLKGSVRSNYVEAHMHESIALLLPEWIEILKPHLKEFDKIDDNVLYSIGLIEKVPHKNTRKFVHRLFAEVLLAEFLIKNLSSRSQNLFVQIVYGEILQLEGNKADQQWHPSKTWAVKYPLISYFVNMHLRDQTQSRIYVLNNPPRQLKLGGGYYTRMRRHGALGFYGYDKSATTVFEQSIHVPEPRIEQTFMNELMLKISNHPNEIQFKQFCEAVVVCVIQDLEFCLKLAMKLLRRLQFGYVNLPELMQIRDTYIKYLLHLVVERSDCKNTLAMALEFAKLEFGTQLSYHVYETNDGKRVPSLTSLHMAAYHGKSHMFAYLVQEYGEQIVNVKHLLHMCVRDSSSNNEKTIRNKLAVIDLFMTQARKFNLNWLNEKLNGRNPFEEHNVHPILRKRLLEMEQQGRTNPSLFNRFLESTGLNIFFSTIMALCAAPALAPSVENSSVPAEAFSQLSTTNENVTDNFQSNNNEPLVITDELIGKGGNSEVYKGTFGQRIVAIKRIKVQKGESEEVNQEIQILIKCDDHDNIVQYLFQSQIESKGRIEQVLVMELCESTLKEFVVNKESCFHRLNISGKPSSIDLLRQMTEGLFHLHNRKDQIIHRDLKPENILLKSRNGRIVVKLADFGISKVIADGKTHHTSKDLAGTIDWIAPELIHAWLSKLPLVRVTVKVDIFSLGCLFWYVLSNGKHPFVRAPSSESEYQPKLEINALENQMLHCNLLLLILFMISFHEKDRPSIENIKNHPIFWPAEKRLLFLTESVDLCNKGQLMQMENWLKINYQKLAGGRHSNFDWIFSKVKGQERGWMGCLSENIEKALQNKKSKTTNKYKEKSLNDLLIGIRNLKAHIREKDDSVKKELGQSWEDFFNYWHSPARFPFLLDFLWTAFQSIQVSELQSYYEGVKFNFAKIMKNENQFVI